MRSVVIGATGHIGTWLVPQLAALGHEVVAVTRSDSQPYADHPAWHACERLRLDRGQEDFAARVAALEPVVVVDLVAFTPAHVRAMVDALATTGLRHYLVASSIWALGRTVTNPVTEDHPREPLDDYGRDKCAIEDLLLEAWRRDGFPATVVRPGQISGPGWDAITPLGNTDRTVLRTIADGGEVLLPNLGQEILHHVHGEDVAQVFRDAVTHREAALGQVFHAVADDDLTTYGAVLAVAAELGTAPHIAFAGWEEWARRCGLADEEIEHSYLHLARSGHFSNARARRLLGFEPRWTSEETLRAAVRSLVDRGLLAA